MVSDWCAPVNVKNNMNYEAYYKQAKERQISFYNAWALLIYLKEADTPEQKADLVKISEPFKYRL